MIEINKEGDNTIIMEGNIKSTTPDAMKINFYIKREQFYKFKQGEGENIIDFESRVRSKAKNCKFGKGCKSSDCKCECNSCTTDREEDEIKTLIMCKMKDKETQKELWKITTRPRTWKRSCATSEPMRLSNSTKQSYPTKWWQALTQR